MSEQRVPMDKKEIERLKRLEAETRARIVDFSAAGNLPRDQLYERGVDGRSAVDAEPQPLRPRAD